MRGRIVLANLELTIVEQIKPTKKNPNNRRTSRVFIKEQVVVGTTPMEVTMFDKHLSNKLAIQYEDPITMMVNKMEIIYCSTKTNYEVK